MKKKRITNKSMRETKKAKKVRIKDGKTQKFQRLLNTLRERHINRVPPFLLHFIIVIVEWSPGLSGELNNKNLKRGSHVISQRQKSIDRTLTLKIAILFSALSFSFFPVKLRKFLSRLSSYSEIVIIVTGENMNGACH